MNSKTEIDGGTKTCLYLHGYKAEDAISDEAIDFLENMGFQVQAFLRRDEEILKGENPQLLYRDMIVSKIQQISDQTGTQLQIIGNSLGSYLAILGAIEVQEKVQSVLCIDPFFDPHYGFTQMGEHDLGVSLENIAELQGKKKFSPALGLLYASSDAYIDPSKKPEEQLNGDIEFKSISHVSDGGIMREAGHRDWQKSPEAIDFIKDFLLRYS